MSKLEHDRSRFNGVLQAYVFAVVLAFAPSVLAQQGTTKTTDLVSLTAYQTLYVNSGMSTINNAGTGYPPPSLDGEIAIRLLGIFSLTAIYSQFADPEVGNSNHVQQKIWGAGAGMKVDMPGFFFLFSRRNDSGRDGKRYPVNTFLFGEILKMYLTDVSTNAPSGATTPRYGFGGDLFLFNPYVYFSFRLSMFNLIGATYFGSSYGLGIRF